MNSDDPGTGVTTTQPAGSGSTLTAQSPAAAAPSSSPIIARLIVGVAVVILLVAAVAAAALVRSRDLYRDRALTATQNLAQLIERDFTAALDKVDLALLSVKDEAESQLAGGKFAARALNAHIAAQYAHQPGLDSLRIAGADGSVEYGVPATSGPRINVADREYFARAREDRAGLVISKPLVGRNSGRWTIVAARRINHPDGRFAGVAFASIFTEQFEKTLAALDLGPYGAATVRNRDLQLVARHVKQASSPTPVGDDRVSKELADALRTNPDFGTYLAATSLDKIERANTYRRMAKYPFYVLVGLATNDYLSIWRAEAVKTSALVMTFALVTALLTGLIASAWRRREADAQRILELSRAALRRSEHRLQHALESADMGVWSLDPETGDFEADAPARLLHGLPPLGPLDRDSAFSSMLAEDRLRASAARDEAMRSGNPFDIEVRVLRPESTPRWIHLSGRREPGSGARAGKLVGLVQDITERKQAEAALRESKAQLEEAARRKDDFLGMLSHELRNPLAPIRSSAYVLQRADPTGEQAARARAVIERQTEHLTRVVDDLLDVTRIVRGKILIQRNRVDLRDIVLRAFEDARLVADGRSVALRAVVPEARVWADADATRVTQIIGNLLGNAIKFTSFGGEIVVTLRDVNATAEISVRDTGAGIDPALLPHVFDPFTQGKRTLARSEGGLGLGLALVKGLTELHGGSVEARSAGVGQGAEFIVTLPLVGPLVHEQPSHTAPRRAAKARHVLVVDDNADAAESLAELVSLFGHSVEVAYDGPSAIQKARALRPDVVLCDLGLPGMTGYEVAQALRAEHDGELRLVAVSGYAQAEDVERATAAGFHAHVAKPADPEKIERLLG